VLLFIQDAGHVVCIAGSKWDEFGVKTQNLHYRPEETRHKPKTRL